MLIVREPEKIKTNGIVATIGFFDGVHLGHRFLINQLKDIAMERELPSSVITFPSHPRTVIQSNYHPRLLNTFAERMAHLSETGIDYCIIQEFTPAISHLSAYEFMKTILAKEWNVKTLVMGYDHKFGHDQNLSSEDYIAYGKEIGIEIIKAHPYGTGENKASSSTIRKALAEGNVEKARRLLNSPYTIHGNITTGHQIGRTLGFPTANIQMSDPYKIIPKTGVYAVWVYLDGNKHKGMLHIGNRPTLENGENITLEVNILDFSENIYNSEITIAFVSYIRDNVKFDSLEQLRSQLDTDRETVGNLLTHKE